MVNHEVVEMLEECLKPTKYCDCSDKRVKDKVRDLVGLSSEPRTVALKIFDYVRDSVLFDATLDIRLPAIGNDEKKRGGLLQQDQFACRVVEGGRDSG